MVVEISRPGVPASWPPKALSSGTASDSADRLRRAGATHLIPTIAHLPGLLQVAGDPAPSPAPDAPAGGTKPTSRVSLESRRAGNDG